MDGIEDGTELSELLLCLLWLSSQTCPGCHCQLVSLELSVRTGSEFRSDRFFEIDITMPDAVAAAAACLLLVKPQCSRLINQSI